MNQKPTIQNLITESDLCELLGTNKVGLGRLRNEENLPFLKVDKTKRVYLESDIMDWLLSRRVVSESK